MEMTQISDEQIKIAVDMAAIYQKKIMFLVWPLAVLLYPRDIIPALWDTFRYKKKMIKIFENQTADGTIDLLCKTGLLLLVEMPDLVVEKIEEAKEHYQHFLDINPEHPEARDIPQWLLKFVEQWKKEKAHPTTFKEDFAKFSAQLKKEKFKDILRKQDEDIDSFSKTLPNEKR